MPVKLAYRVTLGKMLQPAQRTNGEVLRSYLRAANITWGGVDITDVKTMWFSEDEIRQLQLRSGDLLISEGGDVGRSCIWSDELAECYFQNSINRVRAQGGNSNRFLYYCLATIKSAGFIDIICNKSTIAHFTAEKVANLVVPLPSSEEQLSICAFLDQETSKINALISEQQRLIELLKEKRQAVISHAVTKGLNSDVRMKPSGVEWLGEVPEHWEVKKLKRVSPFMSVGIVVNPSSFVSESDDGLPFIYGGDIREGQIDYLNSRRISSAASRTEEKTMLQEGDLLTVRVGAPGVTAVVPKECDGGNCASVMLMRKGAFNSDWLCYVMNARIVRFQVEIVQYGAAQQQFNISHAVNFLIPVPPRAEQDSLVAALDAQLDGFHRLQVEAEKAIGLLQERRTALISAAVTGKIDVLNYAATQKDAA